MINYTSWPTILANMKAITRMTREGAKIYLIFSISNNSINSSFSSFRVWNKFTLNISSFLQCNIKCDSSSTILQDMHSLSWNFQVSTVNQIGDGLHKWKFFLPYISKKKYNFPFYLPTSKIVCPVKTDQVFLRMT